ncbi:MAG: STAS domain-containing protein [Phycisphaerales bacterium]|nr:STAS domain-containing protein [Phycisphaerae bacterium]NNF44189.1 STAS domain-containing protein [Phycisphaerales bacterium]NNM24449.1 STAS domain-containing protein [Phycisphaerales bacterium]
MLRPRGPATQDDAAGLSAKLMEARTRSLGRVVLDISVVPFVDSVVLEHLLDITEELGKTGQALKLSGANDVVREALELTDIASMFELFEDVNSAVRSFL